MIPERLTAAETRKRLRELGYWYVRIFETALAVRIVDGYVVRRQDHWRYSQSTTNARLVAACEALAKGTRGER